MWRFRFNLEGFEERSPDEVRKRRQPKPGKPHGPWSLGRSLGAGLAKGSLVLWAAVAVVSYVVYQSGQADIKVTGPIQTAQGPKWELHGKPSRRGLQELTLVVNGSLQTVKVTNGRLDHSQISLIPGRNTISTNGVGSASRTLIVTVPADPTRMNCDCAHIDGGGGFVGALLGINDLITGQCRDAEAKLKAGSLKWCDPAAMGPGAWPKKP